MQQVPATTSVKRSRVHNVDTDRLLRRRDVLVDLLIHNSGALPTRRRFVDRALELTVIEDCLVRRGELPIGERASEGNRTVQGPPAPGRCCPR